MARERTAADSKTESDDASGGESLLDRGSYRRLANAAVSTVEETTADDAGTDSRRDALDSSATTADD